VASAVGERVAPRAVHLEVTIVSAAPLATTFKVSHNALPPLQAGALPVSQPPAPTDEPRPVIDANAQNDLWFKTNT
jgi:hypothetical protein